MELYELYVELTNIREMQKNEELEILTVAFHVSIIFHFNPVTCKWMHEKINKYVYVYIYI
jgi:hypothetical protein